MNARRAAEIGARFAETLPCVDDRVRRPNLSTVDVDGLLGGDSTFEERTAFEWAVIGGVAKSEGDEMTTLYCKHRLETIIAKTERGETL